MDQWESFAVAQVGAAAVLAGLIFVGVSVNMEQILTSPGLPGRAGEALIVLLELLITASLLLVPGLPLALFGGALLVVGVLGWAGVLGILRRTYSDWDREHPRQYRIRIALAQCATLPYIAVGAAVLLHGEAGLIWLAVATVASFIVAFFNAWILLVEINR